MGGCFIRVFRKRISYKYKRFPNKPDAWDNNDINNMLDDFILYMDEAMLFKAKCQTVANIPGGRFVDTVAPGPFQLKLFVEPRQFYGRIHGIINTFDLEGERIDASSIQPTDNTRWLVHDTQSKKPKPPMQLTRVAWSAGCFVLHPSDLNGFNDIVDAYKYNAGDLIDGELIEGG